MGDYGPDGWMADEWMGCAVESVCKKAFGCVCGQWYENVK